MGEVLLPVRKQRDDWSARIGRRPEPRTPNAVSRPALPRTWQEQRIASSAKWTACPSTRAEDACQYAVGTSRQRIALEAAPRPGGQGVRRRELSRSYLAGRRSRPDRREGCRAPCPPICGTKLPFLPEEQQNRRAGNRGKEGRPRLSGP